jgi:hypothetical protein
MNADEMFDFQVSESGNPRRDHRLGDAAGMPGSPRDDGKHQATGPCERASLPAPVPHLRLIKENHSRRIPRRGRSNFKQGTKGDFKVYSRGNRTVRSMLTYFFQGFPGRSLLLCVARRLRAMRAMISIRLGLMQHQSVYAISRDGAYTFLRWTSRAVTRTSRCDFRVLHH